MNVAKVSFLIGHISNDIHLQNVFMMVQTFTPIVYNCNSLYSLSALLSFTCV